MATRYFDSNGKEIYPPKPMGEISSITEVGGKFDETAIILSVFSESLNKERVTELLCLEPTKAWNPGERHPVGNGKSGKTKITDWGKWWYEADRNYDPVEPKILTLFNLASNDLSAWKTLSSDYQTWLTVSAHLENWNRELSLSPTILKMISERHLELNIDVYFDGDEE